MVTKAEAKAVVLGIADKYGFLDDETLEKLETYDPEIRRKVERSLLAKDKVAGHSILTLAKNIYGSDARFVFELLQNADDNKFKRALHRGELPFISFDVYSDRIVVECNEDGFTVDNLSAICAVGESTKSTSHGYIGTKGIGFKSVFIAAWKVLIQSGHFSFYFKHEKGDPGLGMVIPVWQDCEEEVGNRLTRITLYLHQSGDASDVEHLHQTIFKQLDDLQDTCLMFLRNLKRITIRFHNGDDKEKEFTMSTKNDGKTVLNTWSGHSDGTETTEEKFFHVSRATAKGLSHSSQRDIPDTEEGRTAAAKADVVLAFPLTSASKPLIERQEVFAFLPVRQCEFSFIIQSDFDTSSNRQDIVTTSRRNKDIRKAIARVFVQAVLQFCEHPDLRYSWPAFLPVKDRLSPFWITVELEIARRLEKTPILLSQYSKSLRTIDDVVIPSSNFRDSDDSPLLDETNTFINLGYNYENRRRLKEYGLKVMPPSLAMQLISEDLDDPDSVIKSPSTPKDWHSRLAKFISNALAKKDLQVERVKELAIIPLRDGQWVCASEGSAYWPTAANLEIPGNVGLKIVDPQATKNADRAALYKTLGVQEATVSYVRASIFAEYPEIKPSLDESRQHLRFLYLTHADQDGSKYNRIRVFNEKRALRRPIKTDLYCRGPHPYGAEALLAPTDSTPGLTVKFLHSSYLEDPPRPPNPQHPTWAEWLRSVIGIRETVRIVDRSEEEFSEGFNYVAKHRPTQLLGLLQDQWETEGATITATPKLQSFLREMDAGKFCIRDELFRETKLSFHHTWLPLPNLEKYCMRVMEEDEAFPFLNVGEVPSAKAALEKWKFLETACGVQVEDSCIFRCRIIWHIKNLHDTAASIKRPHRLLDLYEDIYDCWEYKDCKNHLGSFDSIYVPKRRNRQALWVGFNECVWDGPTAMSLKYPLKPLYSSMLASDEQDRLDTLWLFFDKFDIKDASWEDLVSELEELRDNEIEDIGAIVAIYDHINSCSFTDLDDTVRIRVVFRESALIYAIKDGMSGWYETSDCLWSSTTEIRDKVTLSEQYPSLESLFVGIIGVPTLNLQVVYDELSKTCEDADVEQVRGLIWSLNSFLAAESTRPDASSLLKRPIFPVRTPDGELVLTSGTTGFAIEDRTQLAAQFRGKVKVLDYSLEDVWALKPFLEWAGLTNRYLSQCVKEITSVSQGDHRPISTPERDLRYKAHALLRIAASANSPRYKSDPKGLYHLLRHAKTVETAGLRSVLILSQDGQKVEIEKDMGNTHIREDDSGLTIFVPLDRKPQAICFGSALPRYFADWLMRDLKTQIKEEATGPLRTLVTSVLSADLDAVSSILEDEGVVRVPIPNVDELIHEEETAMAVEARRPQYMDGQTDPLRPSTPDTSTGDGHSEPLTPQESIQDTDDNLPTISTEQFTSARSRLARRSPAATRRTVSDSIVLQLPDHVEDNRDYTKLLRNVVDAARRATFPSQGAFDMSSLQEALLSDTVFESFDGLDVTRPFRSHSQLERDKRVGAAGELYTFEILSQVNPALGGWSRNNWQSTIRHYVQSHPDYTDLTPWIGRETSDLVYADDEGDLTSLLIDRGYLAAEEWETARPKYYIEVKSTTGPCHLPFYMSKNQFKRMGNLHRSHAEVYIIFRVYGLGTRNMGLHIYLDPEQLRLNGSLEFTGLTWSVTPQVVG